MNTSIQYFKNKDLIQNTLLPYFCEENPLKLINKLFYSLNYEKYNTHIQPHGPKIIYYPDTKTIEEKTTYKNGIPDGISETYYRNLQLCSRCNYKNGKLNGLHESYYHNNQLATRLNYKNGKLDGLYEVYDENGKLQIKRDYKNGLRDGLFKEYNYKLK